MKHSIWSVVALAGALVWTSPAATFGIRADHADARYCCGEPATFTVSVTNDDGSLVREGTAEIWLDNYGTTPIGERRTVELAKENPIRISGTRSEPGFLRLNAHAPGVKPLAWSVGFEPERIRQQTPEPPDFDEFWAEAKRKFDREVPEDIRLEPIPERSQGDYDCYRISTATYGRRVYGWLSEPKHAQPGSCRVMVNVPGAGIGAGDFVTAKDTIQLTMNVHSYPQPEGADEAAKAKRAAAYAEENRQYGAPHGVERYFHAGIAKSREDYFYYPVILAINRTVDWLSKHPKADRTRFLYCGTSQGGAFGCILGALNSHFTKIGIQVPALTDTLAGADGRQEGWPRILKAHEKNGGADGVCRWMPYFDAANFAARIRCPVRFIVGFADPTCPPHCVYAAYNRVSVAEKRMLDGIGMTHTVTEPWRSNVQQWLDEPPLETWELDNPRIHRRQVDGQLKSFSVRTLERRDDGWILNGKPVAVKAVDWPQAAENCGVELTDRVIKRAVIALKARGYNVLRPRGAPAAALAWCERIGLLTVECPEADQIAAAEIIRPLPLPTNCCPERTTPARVAQLHLSHVHRGGGVRERPDNTLETFLWCWGHGSALECDCRRTADGVGIMLHDDRLRRTGRGISPAFAERSVSKELKWADIADVDVGSYLSPEYATQRIPRMDAVMQAMAGHPKWLLFVDEKGAGPAAIAASARRAGVIEQVYYTGKSVARAEEWMREVPGGKTLVWIGGWPWNHSDAERVRVEAHFRKLRDEIAAAGWSKAVSAISLHTYFDPDFPEPFVPSTDFLRQYIAEFKAHGIPVCSIPFEGGETEEVYYRLFELGCDGFSSDYPSVMFKVIRELRKKANNGR